MDGALAWKLAFTKASRFCQASPMKPDSPKPSGLLLLLLAGIIAVFGPVAGQFAKLREFDVDARFFQFMAVSNFVFLCILLLPITVIILLFIRRKNLRPWLRTLLACIPALVLALPYLGSGLVNPKHAKVVFAERMNHPLPSDMLDLRSRYSHSPGESNYMFCFQTTPAATDELLQSSACEAVEHPAMLDPEIGMHFELPIGGRSVPNGWPRPKTWDGLQIYQSRQIKDYCYILTDASKTKVFVMVGDT